MPADGIDMLGLVQPTAYNAGLFQGLTSLKVVWDHRRIVVNPYPATRLRPFSASVGVHIYELNPRVY